MNTMSYNSEPIGSIALAGRFDFSVFRRFRDSYEPLLGASRITEIRVCLAGVELMDSAALGMLLLLRDKAEARGKRVSLSHCTPGVRDIFRAASFDQLFQLVD